MSRSKAIAILTRPPEMSGKALCLRFHLGRGQITSRPPEPGLLYPVCQFIRSFQIFVSNFLPNRHAKYLDCGLAFQRQVASLTCMGALASRTDAFQGGTGIFLMSCFCLLKKVCQADLRLGVPEVQVWAPRQV